MRAVLGISVSSYRMHSEPGEHTGASYRLAEVESTSKGLASFRHGWIQTVACPLCDSRPVASYLSAVSSTCWSHFFLLSLPFLHETKGQKWS